MFIRSAGTIDYRRISVGRTRVWMGDQDRQGIWAADMDRPGRSRRGGCLAGAWASLARQGRRLPAEWSKARLFLMSDVRLPRFEMDGQTARLEQIWTP